MKCVSTFLSREMRQSFTHEVYGQLQGGDSYASHHYWICGWGKIENGAMAIWGDIEYREAVIDFSQTTFEMTRGVSFRTQQSENLR